MELLPSVLQRRARSTPEDVACVWLDREGNEAGVLTRAALDQRGRAIGGALERAGARGESVMLLFPAGLDFVSAAVGCLYAGAVATAVAWPRPRGGDRLTRIAEDSGATLALTTRAELRRAEDLVGRMRVECVEDIGPTMNEHPRCPDPSDLAILQYTSGSVLDPRGVEVTQRALAANLAMLADALPLDEKSTLVTWLPHFHDMGLVGTLLYPLFAGARVVMLSPSSFLRRPALWIEAMSRYSATASAAPDFAYRLTAARARLPHAPLDLSNWRIAVTSSEPISLDTCQRFSERFSPLGFRQDAFVPAYGLAEGTLFVSGGRVGEGVRSIAVDQRALESNLVTRRDDAPTRTVVSCGTAAPDLTLAIVDPSTCAPCPPRAVGEIWVRGVSIASRYRARPAETAATFEASLAGDDHGPYLRTGDLGFVERGELYVIGRLKDMMTVRGRNLYATDVEQAAATAHPAVEGRPTAAFAPPGGDTEDVVVAVEAPAGATRHERDAIVTAIRLRVAQSLGVGLRDVVLASPGTLPRTSSGKMRRQLCRERYAAGLLASSLDDRAEARSTRAADLIAWLRQYARGRINSQLIGERRSIPPQVVLDFGNKGLLGLMVPEASGGLGLGYVETMAVLEQLAAIDLTLAAFVGVHNALGLPPVMNHARPALRERLLRPLATGRMLAAFAITEPGAGSNPRALAAYAVPTDGGWQLYGEKSWIGSASWAGVIVVFARERDESGNPLGISAFALDADTRGLEIGPEALTTGMRGMVQNSLVLDGAEARAESLLGRSGEGFEIARKSLLLGRLGIAAMSVGAMKRCVGLMVRYASRRSISTGLLLDNAVCLRRIDDAIGAATAVDAFVVRLARLLDGGATLADAAFHVAKIVAPELLWRTADDLVQLLGGRGYVEPNIAPQILRDARLLRIFEGPTEALRHELGSAALTDDVLIANLVAVDLEAPDVAARLRVVIAHGREAVRAAPDRPTARAYTAAAIADAIAYGCLVGAARASGGDGRGAAWAERELRRRLEAVASAAQAPPLAREDVLRAASACVSTIGEVEQRLPAEDWQLDPMLRPDGAAGAAQPPPGVAEVEARPSAADPGQRRLRDWIRGWLSQELELDPASVDLGRPLVYYGLDSLSATELAAALEEELGYRVSVADALAGTTIDQFLDAVRRGSPPAEGTGELLSPERETHWV